MRAFARSGVASIALYDMTRGYKFISSTMLVALS